MSNTEPGVHYWTRRIIVRLATAVGIDNIRDVMHFEIVGEIKNLETFASGKGIRELRRLNRVYGKARWRKRKGIATVRFKDGSARLAELHWYEAAGIGKKEFKIKRFLD